MFTRLLLVLFLQSSSLRGWWRDSSPGHGSRDGAETSACWEYTASPVALSRKWGDELEVTFTVSPLPSGCGAIKSVMKEQRPSQRLWGTTPAWPTWGNCCFLRPTVFRANLVTRYNLVFYQRGSKGKRVADIPNREGICVCGFTFVRTFLLTQKIGIQ